MTSSTATKDRMPTETPNGRTTRLARIAAGDVLAFGALVDEQAERLRAIAYHMLGDRHEAEDIAQETLVRVWRDAAQLAPSMRNLGSWCTRVAMNLCLDRLRRRRFASDDTLPETADGSANQAGAIDERRLQATVGAALASLPDRQRAALVLTYYEELPNMNAAAALDLNIKAFESLLLRARSAVRKAFEAAGLTVASFGREDEGHG